MFLTKFQFLSRSSSADEAAKITTRVQKRHEGSVRVLLVLIILVLVFSGLSATAQQVEKTELADSVKIFYEKKAPGKAMLFSVEFRGHCGPPQFPSFTGNAIAAVLSEKMTVIQGGDSPLISREALEYSLIGTSGETSLYTGRVLAEVGPGSELNFKTDKGKSVVLQIDVKSICWNVDQKEAMAKAEQAEATHLLLATVHVMDLTGEINPGGALGSQKSVRVQLDITKIDVKTGSITGAFSDEKRQMDISIDGAVNRAVKYLAKKGLESM